MATSYGTPPRIPTVDELKPRSYFQLGLFPDIPAQTIKNALIAASIIDAGGGGGGGGLTAAQQAVLDRLDFFQGAGPNLPNDGGDDADVFLLTEDDGPNVQGMYVSDGAAWRYIDMRGAVGPRGPEGPIGPAGAGGKVPPPIVFGDGALGAGAAQFPSAAQALAYPTYDAGGRPTGLTGNKRNLLLTTAALTDAQVPPDGAIFALSVAYRALVAATVDVNRTEIYLEVVRVRGAAEKVLLATQEAYIRNRPRGQASATVVAGDNALLEFADVVFQGSVSGHQLNRGDVLKVNMVGYAQDSATTWTTIADFPHELRLQHLGEVDEEDHADRHGIDDDVLAVALKAVSDSQLTQQQKRAFRERIEAFSAGGDWGPIVNWQRVPPGLRPEDQTQTHILYDTGIDISEAETIRLRWAPDGTDEANTEGYEYWDVSGDALRALAPQVSKDFIAAPAGTMSHEFVPGQATGFAGNAADYETVDVGIARSASSTLMVGSDRGTGYPLGVDVERYFRVIAKQARADNADPWPKEKVPSPDAWSAPLVVTQLTVPEAALLARVLWDESEDTYRFFRSRAVAEQTQVRFRFGGTSWDSGLFGGNASGSSDDLPPVPGAWNLRAVALILGANAAAGLDLVLDAGLFEGGVPATVPFRILDASTDDAIVTGAAPRQLSSDRNVGGGVVEAPAFRLGLVASDYQALTVANRDLILEVSTGNAFNAANLRNLMSAYQYREAQIGGQAVIDPKLYSQAQFDAIADKRNTIRVVS